LGAKVENEDSVELVVDFSHGGLFLIDAGIGKIVIGTATWES
jgi:hypothetical protein